MLGKILDAFDQGLMLHSTGSKKVSVCRPMSSIIFSQQLGYVAMYEKYHPGKQYCEDCVVIRCGIISVLCKGCAALQK